MATQLQDIIKQGIKAAKYIRNAPEFISKNKLWKGYFKHGWMSTATIIIALLLSYKFFVEFSDLLSTRSNPEMVQQGNVSFLSGMSEISNKLFFTGIMKYLLLIVLEMVIFHFAVKTYEVLSGERRELKVKDFVDAQIRMIKVALRSWIYELLLGVVVLVILQILGLKILVKGFSFAIQCYFIGVAFLDNYNEQFNLTVKESFKLSYKHIGAALLVGLTAYALLLLPLVGALMAPFVCAVGATSYMYYTEGKLVPEIKEDFV